MAPGAWRKQIAPTQLIFLPRDLLPVRTTGLYGLGCEAAVRVQRPMYTLLEIFYIILGPSKSTYNQDIRKLSPVLAVYASRAEQLKFFDRAEHVNILSANSPNRRFICPSVTLQWILLCCVNRGPPSASESRCTIWRPANGAQHGRHYLKTPSLSGFTPTPFIRYALHLEERPVKHTIGTERTPGGSEAKRHNPLWASGWGCSTGQTSWNHVLTLPFCVDAPGCTASGSLRDLLDQWIS